MRIPALSTVPCREFYSHYGLRSSVPEKSQSQTMLTSSAFSTFTHLKKRKNTGQQSWTKSSLSPLGKPPQTRLTNCAILQAPHGKQSRPGLYHSPPGASLARTLMSPRTGLLEWSIKYHGIDLMSFKSPSWVVLELLVFLPMHHCARKAIAIYRSRPTVLITHQWEGCGFWGAVWYLVLAALPLDHILPNSQCGCDIIFY